MGLRGHEGYTHWHSIDSASTALPWNLLLDTIATGFLVHRWSRFPSVATKCWTKILWWRCRHLQSFCRSRKWSGWYRSSKDFNMFVEHSGVSLLIFSHWCFCIYAETKSRVACCRFNVKSLIGQSIVGGTVHAEDVRKACPKLDIAGEFLYLICNIFAKF